MDANRFDYLTLALSEAGTRRGLLGLLATLPVLGGLVVLLDFDEVDGKGRRKRRKKRHKHGKGRDKGKHKKQKCKPRSRTTTCSGKCGPVKNNCKKMVDCGSCDCDPSCGACETCTDALICEPCDPCCDEVCCGQPNAICHADSGACCVPDSKAQTCNNQCRDVINNCGVSVDCGPCTCPGGCPACQVCDAEIGECIPDSSQEGGDCGQDGQVCQSDGTCSCEASSCPSCTTCENDGFCAACADCCDGNGVCQDGDTDTACSSSGTCDVCTGQEECQNQTCVCVPDCAGRTCGPDGCGGQCGSCTLPDTCGGGGTPGVCGCTAQTCSQLGKNCGTVNDGCGETIDCGTCNASGTTPICRDNVCSACSATNPCPTGQCCAGDGICGPCLVFVTSSAHKGKLGGLTGADAICQAEATAASLPGTYMAWLSDGAASPSTRFLTQASGPYRLVTGETVANNWTALTTTLPLQHVINVTAAGATVVSPVWTYTQPNGSATGGGRNCGNWTSDYILDSGERGGSLETDGRWTHAAYTPCDLSCRLYCFQQS
jgi:hypothetical protein